MMIFLHHSVKNAKNLSIPKIYWLVAGMASSVCIYGFTVDFVTKNGIGEPFYTWRGNTVTRILVLPLSLVTGFTIGPILGPPFLIALHAKT